QRGRPNFSRSAKTMLKDGIQRVKFAVLLWITQLTDTHERMFNALTSTCPTHYAGYWPVNFVGSTATWAQTNGVLRTITPSQLRLAQTLPPAQAMRSRQPPPPAQPPPQQQPPPPPVAQPPPPQPPRGRPPAPRARARLPGPRPQHAWPPCARPGPPVPAA